MMRGISKPPPKRGRDAESDPLIVGWLNPMTPPFHIRQLGSRSWRNAKPPHQRRREQMGKNRRKKQQLPYGKHTDNIYTALTCQLQHRNTETCRYHYFIRKNYQQSPLPSLSRSSAFRFVLGRSLSRALFSTIWEGGTSIRFFVVIHLTLKHAVQNDGWNTGRWANLTLIKKPLTRWREHICLI